MASCSTRSCVRAFSKTSTGALAVSGIKESVGSRPVADVTVRPVASRRDLNAFIKLPFRIHRDHPRWVAPLIFDRKAFLDRSKNPFFEHAEAEYFLAERDGRVVGRITAHIDRRWDEFQG